MSEQEEAQEEVTSPREGQRRHKFHQCLSQGQLGACRGKPFPGAEEVIPGLLQTQLGSSWRLSLPLWVPWRTMPVSPQHASAASQHSRREAPGEPQMLTSTSSSCGFSGVLRAPRISPKCSSSVLLSLQTTAPLGTGSQCHPFQRPSFGTRISSSISLSARSVLFHGIPKSEHFLWQGLHSDAPCVSLQSGSEKSLQIHLPDSPAG